jgi:2-C-methyl-D-erythritol 2,4-cyclodiphosphate synthase
MVVGGVQIECPVGPIAHSDGDAVMHAVTDSILSATNQPDLGTLFPNTDESNRDKQSRTFLVEAITRANAGGWAIGNIDITVICDEPKISSFKKQICDSLNALIGAPISIKGKTHEGTARGGAIEVHVVALVQRGLH